jgi:hypothetical protein
LARARFVISLEALPFTFDAREVGTRCGQRAGRFIACRTEHFFTRLVLGQRLSDARQFRACLLRRLLRLLQGLLDIAFGGKPAVLVLDPPGFCMEASEATFDLHHFRLGHAPFGFDTGLVCTGLGKRQFGHATGAFRLIYSAGNRRTFGFVAHQGGFAGSQLLRQPAQRFGGVAGQAIGVAAIFLQPPALTIEVGQALFGSLQLAGKGRHAMAMGTGIVAPVSQGVACLGHLGGKCGLQILRAPGFRLRPLD